MLRFGRAGTILCELKEKLRSLREYNVVLIFMRAAMKKILMACLIWANTAMADMPKSAICSPMKGMRLEVSKQESEFKDDRVSNKIGYQFLYDDSLISDSLGFRYTMLSTAGSVVGILHKRLGDTLVTFYPKENKIVMSRHSYDAGLGGFYDWDISAWIMVGDCEFRY